MAKGIILGFLHQCCLNIYWEFVIVWLHSSIWRMRETFRPIQKAMPAWRSPDLQWGGGCRPPIKWKKRRHQWWHFSFRDDKTIIPIQHAFAGSQSRCVSDMFLPTLQNVTFWRATRCGWWIFEFFFKKMPKITISWCKMYKPGNSGWNQISVLPDDSITRHEHFLLNIGDFWLFLKFFEQFLVNHIW